MSARTPPSAQSDSSTCKIGDKAEDSVSGIQGEYSGTTVIGCTEDYGDQSQNTQDWG